MKKEVLKFTAEVSARNIKKGITSGSQCPIALAIKRVFGKKLVYLDVSSSLILRLKRRGVVTHFKGATPRRAIRFWENFDDGKTVKPSSFNLKVVSVQ